jgi:putative redox protein
MTAQVIYTTELRTEATHLQSGTMIETDAPKDNLGKGERFSPTDLVATALGSCMVSIMAIAGRTHDINVDGTKVDIEKIMIADPQRRIAEIKAIFHFPIDKKYSDKERKILEHSAMNCPVLLSLHPNTKKTIDFNWGASAL